MRTIEEQAQHRTEDLIYDQVRYQVQYQVEDQVEIPVWFQILGLVWDRKLDPVLTLPGTYPVLTYDETN